MSKKCQNCGVPLEGFFAKIASLAGVKPSTTRENFCNKCENAPVPEVQSAPIVTEAPTPMELVPDTKPVEETPIVAPELVVEESGSIDVDIAPIVKEAEKPTEPVVEAPEAKAEEKPVDPVLEMPPAPADVNSVPTEEKVEPTSTVE